MIVGADLMDRDLRVAQAPDLATGIVDRPTLLEVRPFTADAKKTDAAALQGELSIPRETPEKAKAVAWF
jgi:hypothetical protein